MAELLNKKHRVEKNRWMVLNVDYQQDQRFWATIQSNPWPSCQQCPPSPSKPWPVGLSLGPAAGTVTCQAGTLLVAPSPLWVNCHGGMLSHAWVTVTLLPEGFTLCQAFTDLPLFPIPSPHWSQGSAVGRHLQPWGHTKILIFHELLEIWVFTGLKGAQLHWPQWALTYSIKEFGISYKFRSLAFKRL